MEGIDPLFWGDIMLEVLEPYNDVILLIIAIGIAFFAAIVLRDALK